MADWQAAYERLKTRQQNEAERSSEMVMLALDEVANYGGAALVGYLHGRRGGIPAVGGVPVDAGIAGLFGLIGWGLVLSGFTWGRTIARFGGGAGAYWVGAMFAEWGQKRREKAGEKLGRQLTTEEAQKAKVIVRPPIMGGARGSGAALRAEFDKAA